MKKNEMTTQNRQKSNAKKKEKKKIYYVFVYSIFYFITGHAPWTVNIFCLTVQHYSAYISIF